MKKFLLSLSLILMGVAAFAQVPCPTSARRNNGNGNARCNPFGGTGGTLTLTYGNQPPANLQLFQIVGSTGQISTIVEESKIVTQKPNGDYEIEFCFETDNAGPLVGAQYQFYIDVFPFGTREAEQLVLCTQATLPVILGNFNAINKSGKVSLSWETYQEVENDGFEIQRRVATGKYITVAFVDSKVIGGTGSGTTYSFDDNAPLAKGVTYYRLRQVDLNGQAAFSEVKALRGVGSSIVVSVYPNPSRGTTNVAIPEGTGTMDVTLDDFAGRSVQRWNGLNVRNLQLTNLKPGMYLLRITIRETGEQITERVTVQ